jgi:hypothetical protein
VAKTRVFKLQRALLSSEASPPVLAYDQHRRFNLNLPATPELLKLFGDDHKIYVNATPRGDTLLVHDRVRPRAW